MKTPSELYYEYGEKAQIPEYASEVFIITEYKFTKALEEYVAQQVSVAPEVKVNFAEIVKEILQEGANVANYGNPFESEDTVRIGREILFDETVEKYSNILSKISA